MRLKNSPDGVDWDFGVDVSVDLGGVHVRDVLEVGGEAVVLADEGVEDISEVNIGVLITSIDTAMLVVEFNGAGNSLGQGELRGLGDNLVELVPFVFSHVLGNQGVLGLDFGERSHGPEDKKNQAIRSAFGPIIDSQLASLIKDIQGC